MQKPFAFFFQSKTLWSLPNIDKSFALIENNSGDINMYIKSNEATKLLQRIFDINHKFCESKAYVVKTSQSSEMKR